MNRGLAVTVSRSWLLGIGSTIAVVALVAGLWAGISLGSPGPASVVAASYDSGILDSSAQTKAVSASYDSGSLASKNMATDGYGKVKGAACSGSVED